MGYKTILLKDGGVRELFPYSRWGMKFSLIVRNYPAPWHPGLKATAPLDILNANSHKRS